MLAYRHSIGSSLSHAGTCALKQESHAGLRLAQNCPPVIGSRIASCSRGETDHAGPTVFCWWASRSSTRPKPKPRVYQIVMLVLLSLVPALTIIDFWEVAGRGCDGNFKDASLFKSRRHFSSAGLSRHLFRLIQRGKYGFRLCVSLAERHRVGHNNAVIEVL
jgi:hypothetical protein